MIDLKIITDYLEGTQWKGYWIEKKGIPIRIDEANKTMFFAFWEEPSIQLLEDLEFLFGYKISPVREISKSELLTYINNIAREDDLHWHGDMDLDPNYDPNKKFELIFKMSGPNLEKTQIAIKKFLNISNSEITSLLKELPVSLLVSDNKYELDGLRDKIIATGGRAVVQEVLMSN